MPASAHEVARQLQQFAQRFGMGSGDLLDPVQVVKEATSAIPCATAAGLTLVRGTQRPRTLAASASLAEQVDGIQYETGEGPCLEAIEDDDIARVDDLAGDPRWPKFSARAVAETPVRSMFGVRVFLGNSDRGALNFYSTDISAFTDLDVGIGAVFSTLAALSLRNSVEVEHSENLSTALGTSRQIGIAMGIIMARRLVTSEQAFDELRRLSQRRQLKLRDVAATVAETGELPEDD